MCTNVVGVGSPRCCTREDAVDVSVARVLLAGRPHCLLEINLPVTIIYTVSRHNISCCVGVSRMATAVVSPSAEHAGLRRRGHAGHVSFGGKSPNLSQLNTNTLFSHMRPIYCLLYIVTNGWAIITYEFA